MCYVCGLVHWCSMCFCEDFLAQRVVSILLRCIWAARFCHCIVMVEGGGRGNAPRQVQWICTKTGRCMWLNWLE